MEVTIRFTLNRRPVTLRTDGDRTLLSVLRSDFDLTGAKYGCGVGLCGACTVIVGERAVRTCTKPITAVAGQEVLTVEGLAHDAALHPLQQAFIDHGAVQPTEKGALTQVYLGGITFELVVSPLRPGGSA